MYNIIICYLTIIFTLDYTGALKINCKNEDGLLQQCSKAISVLNSPEISLSHTHDELDKNCVELRAGIRCIDNYTEVCMEKKERLVFKSIYAGITVVVHELCTKGSYQDEYLRHAECVKNVRSEYETCSKDYEVTLTTIGHGENQNGSNVEDNLRTVCCKFQEYILCSERTVARHCGEDAAVFTGAFLKRMASNIIKVQLVCNILRPLCDDVTRMWLYTMKKKSLHGIRSPGVRPNRPSSRNDSITLLTAVTILGISVILIISI